MTRFTLVVRPDGSALLTTPERLSVQMAAELGRQLRGWHQGEFPIAVISECDVVQIREVDIDLVDRAFADARRDEEPVLG